MTVALQLCSELPELKYHRGTILQYMPSNQPTLLLMILLRHPISGRVLVHQNIVEVRSFHVFCYYFTADLWRLNHKGTICTVPHCDCTINLTIIRHCNEFSITVGPEKDVMMNHFTSHFHFCFASCVCVANSFHYWKPPLPLFCLWNRPRLSLKLIWPAENSESVFSISLQENNSPCGGIR